MAAQTHTLIIKPRPPYDLAKTAERLKGIQHEMYRFEGDKLVRTIRVKGKIYLIKVSGNRDMENPLLNVEVETHENSVDLEAVQQHLERMFTTELDLEPLYAHMEQDPALAPLARQYRGLRLVLESDLFECMIKTIVGQQLNLAFAATLNKRLMEVASLPFVVDHDFVYPVFPSVEEVAKLSYDDLRELQFSQRKAEYVIDFARIVAEGELDLFCLENKSDEEIMDGLVKLRGIGRWSAECFLLFGLGRPDLLPAADIGLRNGIRMLYELDHQPKEEEVRGIGEAWSPWKSYMTFYIWESLNQGKKSSG